MRQAKRIKVRRSTLTVQGRVSLALLVPLLLLSFATLSYAQSTTDTTTTTDTTDQPVKSQEDPNAGIVLGIGVGVLLIIIFSLISIGICCISPMFDKPEFVVLGAILLPVIIFIIFYAAPKEIDKIAADQKQFTSDRFAWARVFCLVLLFSGFFITLSWLSGFYIFQQRVTRKPSNWYRDRDSNMNDKNKRKQLDQKRLQKGDGQDQQGGEGGAGGQGDGDQQQRLGNWTDNYQKPQDPFSLPAGGGQGRQNKFRNYI